MKSPTNILPRAFPAPASSAPVPFGSPGFGVSPWTPPTGAATSDRNRISTYYLASYVFLLSSLVYQILSSYVGISAPLVAGTFFILFLIYLISGRYMRFASCPLVYPWIGLMVWWLIAGALGDFPRRSLTYLAEYAFRIHTLPLIFCSLLLSARNVRTVLYGAGVGLPVLLLFCAKFGIIVENRLLIPDTSFANANDLALHLLLYGSFFLVFLTAGRGGRVFGFIVIPCTIYYVLKTGSRAAALTLVAIFVVSFFILPTRKKFLLVIVGVLALGLIPLLPRQTVDRLRTLFDISSSQPNQATGNMSEDDYRLMQAADSTKARLDLQRRAIQLTLDHPVFGIGPLNFEDAIEKMVQSKEGKKSGWQVSHNSYLQVSSETGIPGLLLYVWTIFLCLRLNYQAFRKLMREPDQRSATLQAFALWLATITYAIGIFFCSIAYDYYLAILVAFTAANYLAVKQFLESVKPEPKPAVVVEKRRPMPLKPSMR